MAVTETWLHNHTDAEISIDGYNFFRCDRERIKKSTRGRFSGGVGCYVKTELSATMEKIVEFSNGVVELLGLYSKKKNILVAVIYRQPDDIKGGHRSTHKELQQALNKLCVALNSLSDPTPNIIFCGDFNIRGASWPDGVPSGRSSTQDKQLLQTLTEFTNERFLNQYIITPTHIEDGVLDLVFSNNESMVHSYNMVKPLRTTSDHFVIEINTPLLCEKVEKENPPPYVSALDNLNFFSNEISWDIMSTEIESLTNSNEFTRLHPNDRLDRFLSILTEVAYKHVPCKISSAGKPTTQIPRARRILMRKRRKLTNQSEFATSPARKEKIRNKLVSIELLLQQSYIEARNSKEKLAVKAMKTNPRFFFSYAKQFSITKTKIGPLLNSNNEFTNVSTEMANILSKQYSSVFSEPCDSPYLEDVDNPDIPTLTDVTFNEDDLSDAIDEISLTAASGPDGLCAIFLKKCKSSLLTPLTELWRDCLDLGVTPEKLKEAHIIPVYKGGNQGVAANYRPIALTSHLIKVFEKVMRKKIVEFLQTHHLLNDSQHGFTEGHSCLSQLLAHHDKVLSILECGSNVDTIYLDFAKAFDKVDHSILLKKLSLLGVRGKILKWITSFLTSRTQLVMVNGFLSDSAPVISGVPQGSVLGPLLFLVLISDIDADVVFSFLSSFADDTRVSKGVTGVVDASSLQTDLEAIYQWAVNNNMLFNNMKFEVVRRGSDSTLKLCTSYTSPNGTVINEKTNVKDLGVTMSSDCTFKEHINKICQSARNMCSWILRTFTSRSPDLMITTWKSLVLPILEYSSQLWSPTRKGQIQQLEEIQKSFTRKIHAANREDYWLRLKSLHLYSLERRRERYRIIYAWKILEGLVPNLEINELRCTRSSRNGRMCIIPNTANTSPSHLKTLREGSFCINGARLFNCLPKQIRDLSGIDTIKFKENLDEFLSTIPDEPQCCGYTGYRRAETNSLLHMVTII